jgi:O-antigen ligase
MFSAFVKILKAEIPDVSILGEIIIFKTWLNPVLLFFILFNIINDEETCNKTLFGLCLLVFVLILTQLLATFGITNYGARSIERFGRVGGFGAAGEYAITLALLLPFVLSISFLAKKGFIVKFVGRILVFLILMGLVNAGSRNGAVTLLCSLTVYLVLLKREKIMGFIPIVLLATMMIVVGTAAFLASPSGVKEVVTERFDPTTAEDVDELTSGRTDLWKNGWKLFIESPLWGHGNNTFKELSRLKGYPRYGHPHNEYLKHLAENGVIGFSVFLLIFYKIYQNVQRALSATGNRWQKLLYLSYLSGLISFMVGIFATNTGPSLYLFWIYTGIIYKYIQLEKNKEESIGEAMIA